MTVFGNGDIFYWFYDLRKNKEEESGKVVLALIARVLPAVL